MAKQYVVCVPTATAAVYGKPIHDGSKVVIIVEGADAQRIAKLNKALEELKALDHDEVMAVGDTQVVQSLKVYEAKRVREFRGA